MSTLRHISWSEIVQLVETIHNTILQTPYENRPSIIVPIGGGGIIPASILAYQMYNRDGKPVNLAPPIYVKSYDNDPEHGHHECEFTAGWAPYGDVPDLPTTLFVDEICDTGGTIKFLREYWRNARFASLVTKNDVPDFYALHDDRKHWWVFPWEQQP